MDIESEREEMKKRLKKLFAQHSTYKYTRRQHVSRFAKIETKTTVHGSVCVTCEMFFCFVLFAYVVFDELQPALLSSGGAILLSLTGW